MKVSQYRARRHVWLLCIAASSACTSPGARAAPADPPRSHERNKPRVEVDVLATARESTWLRDSSMLPAAPCADCATLRVSAGEDDREPGPQRSAPLRELGYVAALGDPQLTAAGATTIVERAGVKFEIIALSRRAYPGAQLGRALRARADAIRDHGADAGILISDACLRDLHDTLRRGGPDWAFLVLAIGRACGEAPQTEAVSSVTLMAAEERAGRAATAQLTFDRHTAALLQARVGKVAATEALARRAPVQP